MPLCALQQVAGLPQLSPTRSPRSSNKSIERECDKSVSESETPNEAVSCILRTFSCREESVLYSDVLTASAWRDKGLRTRFWMLFIVQSACLSSISLLTWNFIFFSLWLVFIFSNLSFDIIDRNWFYKLLFVQVLFFNAVSFGRNNKIQLICGNLYIGRENLHMNPPTGMTQVYWNTLTYNLPAYVENPPHLRDTFYQGSWMKTLMNQH